MMENAWVVGGVHASTADKKNLGRRCKSESQSYAICCISAYGVAGGREGGMVEEKKKAESVIILTSEQYYSTLARSSSSLPPGFLESSSSLFDCLGGS